MVESGAVNTATEPSGNPDGELLTTEQMADWHNRMNACQSFDDASEFYTALDTCLQHSDNSLTLQSH
jgi:hypothetical protein